MSKSELTLEQYNFLQNEYENDWDCGKYLIVGVKKGPNPREISFRVRPNIVVPDAYFNLETEIEHACTILTVMFPDDDEWSRQRFNIYFTRLKNLARSSLGQDQVTLGSLALKSLQDDIVIRESGRIKNKYIIELGKWAAIFGAVFFGAYLISLGDPLVSKTIKDKTFFLMMLGSMLGTWLSFSIRKPTLAFAELAAIEKDLLDPKVRLLFVAGLTIVVALILATGMVVITVGAFKTNFLMSQAVGGDFNAGVAAMRAILIGCLCGIGEQALPNAVGQRATAFVGALGGTTAGAVGGVTSGVGVSVGGGPGDGGRGSNGGGHKTPAEEAAEKANVAETAKKDAGVKADEATKAKQEASDKSEVLEKAKREAAQTIADADKARKDESDKAAAFEIAKTEAAQNPSSKEAQEKAAAADKAKTAAAKRAEEAERAKNEFARKVQAAEPAKKDADEKAVAAEKAATEAVNKAAAAKKAADEAAAKVKAAEKTKQG